MSPAIFISLCSLPINGLSSLITTSALSPTPSVVSGGTTNGTLSVQVFVPKKPRAWVHDALSLKSQEILRLYILWLLYLQITFHVSFTASVPWYSVP